MSRGLLRSTAVVSAMTLVSRVLGFLRDMVFARFFGAGEAMDAFFVAFKIPNFMRRLFAEGAFSQAFVPVLSEYRQQRGQEAVKALVDRVAGVLGGVLALITVVGVVAAPLLILLFAPGFLRESADKFDLAAELLRLTFPYLFFISLTAFAGGILNSYGRFGVPAFTPVLLNLVLIAFALVAAPRFETPVVALALGVLVAGLAQLAFQLPFLMRLGLLPRPRWDRTHQGVRKILRLMMPALFGSSVAQINLLLDTLIASFLVSGSVSWLYYSDRLMEFPLGVFGIALSTVILPSLSRRHADGSREAFSATLDWALRWAVVIAVPATAGLALLAVPVLVTLFQYQAFTPADARMAGFSLTAYALGLGGFMLVKVLAPGFYARQDTATPVRIGLWAMGANMLFNIAFVVPMVWLGMEAPHAGLALATALGAWVNAALLFRRLRREGAYRPLRGWGSLVARMAVALAAMALLLHLLAGPPDLWYGMAAGGRVLRLAGLIAAAAACYLIVLLLLGVRPWRWRTRAE